MFQLILKILFFTILIVSNENDFVIAIETNQKIIRKTKNIIKFNRTISGDINYNNNNNIDNYNNNNRYNSNINNVNRNNNETIDKFIKPRKISKNYLNYENGHKKPYNFYNNNIIGRHRHLNGNSIKSISSSFSKMPSSSSIYFKLNDKSEESSSSSNNSSFSKFYKNNNKLMNKVKLKENKTKRDIKNENICLTECKCNFINNLLTVHCQFSESRLYIFGATKFIPKETTSLLIELPRSSQLRIDEGFFHGNKVNRILIRGSSDSNELIELGPHGFLGNSGPFPEIDIINCHSVLLRSNVFYDEFKLNITNCKEVDISANSFYNTTFHGHFENINSLRLSENAFTKATAKVDVINCHIDELKRLDASLKEIKFLNSTINKIISGTFDVISINSIIFENCQIGTIMNNTATERLYSGHLAIIGCDINVMETNAIDRSGITKFVFSNNSVATIQKNAINLTSIHITISDNTINVLDHNWFSVRGWSHVIINDNKFGNFDQLTIGKTDNPVECTFKHNFITNAANNSLNFTNPYCKIKEISFFHPCICNFEWLYKLTTNNIKSESYCTINDLLKLCFNTSLINVQKYDNDICNAAEQQTLDCMKKKVDKPIDNSNFIHPNIINNTNNFYYRNLYIIIGSIIIVIIIIIITVIIIIIKRRCRKNVSPTTSSFEMSSTHEFTTTTFKNSPLQFSTADRVIINQTMLNMKKKYPAEKYDQVYNNTKKLLQGHLTECEKVSIISEIIRNIYECDNSSDDFVAFNDILYRHLAPKDDNQNDPVYEEPNLINNNNNNNTNNNNNNNNNNNTSNNSINNIDNTNINPNNNNGQTILFDQHIYMEPNNVEQPLLRNEYSAPLDRNENINVYTEPIASHHKENANKAINPYAISKNRYDVNDATENDKINNDSTIRQYLHNEQQPSTSKNLPDILKGPTKSQNTTSQQLSNSLFNNNNNYHSSRSPLTNRKIPQYTIPNTTFKIRPSSITSTPSEDINTTASDHSGGSDVTLPIDERIEYVDA